MGFDLQRVQLVDHCGWVEWLQTQHPRDAQAYLDTLAADMQRRFELPVHPLVTFVLGRAHVPVGDGVSVDALARWVGDNGQGILRLYLVAFDPA